MRRLIIVLLVLALAGCYEVNAPEAIPTGIPPTQITAPPADGGTAEPTIIVDEGANVPVGPTATPPGPTPTPAPTATLPPVLLLPDAEGVTLACAANTLVLDLDVPDVPVSRLETRAEGVYVILNGALVRYDRDQLEGGQLARDVLLPVGQMVETRPVQELTDLVITPDGTTIYVLDKSGSIYRFDLPTRDATLVYDGRDIGLDVGPQFLAIDLDEQARPVVLDTANGNLWRPTNPLDIARIGASRGFTSGHDVVRLGDTYYVMRQNNVIMQTRPQGGADVYQDATGRQLALALKTSRHLGTDTFITVDAVKREVVTIMPEGALPVTRHAFVFDDMGLLRDAAFIDGRLYGIADHRLYVYPNPALDGQAAAEACPPPNPQPYARLYGVDLLAATADLIYPIEGGTLPLWPRVYPGASRLYRRGVHRGVDIYQFNGPAGFGTGWPIVSMGDGEVVESTIPYDGFNSTQFFGFLAQAEEEGQTPSNILNALYGRKVIIEYADGIRATYAHMEDIEETMLAGVEVQQGELIGTVGVSGTQGEVDRRTVASHLHFDIYIGERFIGQGITIRETMWWYAQIFEEAVYGQ